MKAGKKEGIQDTGKNNEIRKKIIKFQRIFRTSIPIKNK